MVDNNVNKDQLSLYKKIKLSFQNVTSNKSHHVFKKMIMLALASLLLTITFNYFINPVGFFNGGFSGISQIIVYSIFDDSKLQETWFYIISLLLNIPFIIFGYLKVGKRFTIYTLFFMLMQNVWNLLFGYIPILANLKIMEQLITSTGPNSYAIKTLGAFIYGFIGSIIWGFSIALAFIAGGSSGGSDFVAAYLAVWKKQGVGKFQKYLNYAVIILGIFIRHLVEKENQNLLYAFFENYTLYVSIIFATVSATVTNIVYPKFKLVQVLIFTKLPLDVIEYFKTHQYPHDTTLTNGADIKSGKVSGIIFATISLIEYKNIKYNVMQIDPSSFIVVLPVTIMAGQFNIPRFT